MYQYYNPNPYHKSVGDCTLRALTKALGISWDRAYAETVVHGFRLGDMPSSDNVWSAPLRMRGFIRSEIPCSDCYTIEDFCRDHPTGTYVVGTGTHAACVQDGTLYDAWDSSHETVSYFWRNER